MRRGVVKLAVVAAFFWLSVVLGVWLNPVMTMKDLFVTRHDIELSR